MASNWQKREYLHPSTPGLVRVFKYRWGATLIEVHELKPKVDKKRLSNPNIETDVKLVEPFIIDSTGDWATIVTAVDRAVHEKLGWIKRPPLVAEIDRQAEAQKKGR